ncbi:type II toxin-antitoxin system HigB family toxin [Pseudomonas sp. TH31]|uniref:type II toxin-antitoxin system HigB family toxin n=1 Tax=Pseudomonas sp. TH31 TaxID=2796396 RepID=UPI0019128074|nr:type II toxin-antitoxin system HigB family toxin [Pseudomonas sp. TH31]MBK5415841.1 type II toxin-antitoxin system HigB family toxin [Pseudomonas sp. TH31]
MVYSVTHSRAGLLPQGFSGILVASSAALKSILKMARPKEFADLQKLFGTHGIDLFKPRAAMNWVVIDVGGNNLRVLGAVNYTRQKFYVKHIYTHADYDVANVWYARNKGVKR